MDAFASIIPFESAAISPRFHTKSGEKHIALSRIVYLKVQLNYTLFQPEDAELLMLKKGRNNHCLSHLFIVILFIPNSRKIDQSLNEATHGISVVDNDGGQITSVCIQIGHCIDVQYINLILENPHICSGHSCDSK